MIKQADALSLIGERKMKKIKVRTGPYTPTYRKPTSPPQPIQKEIKAKISECKFCRENEEDREKMSSCYVDISYITLGGNKGLKVYSHYCPPFAKCANNWKSDVSFFPVKYCPYCGRKL